MKYTIGRLRFGKDPYHGWVWGWFTGKCWREFYGPFWSGAADVVSVILGRRPL